MSTPLVVGVVMAMPYLGNLSAQDRDAAQNLIADAVGIRFQKAWFPPGTALIEYGEKAKAALKAEYDRLPLLKDAIAGMQQRIAAMGFIDAEVNIHEARLEGRGFITSTNNPTTRAEALEQVGKALSLSERVLQNAATLWNQDGELGAGNTMAGLVNALTAAAQEEEMEYARVIQEGAGKLVVGGWEAL